MAQHDLNRDEMLQTISDLHKDAYGFRPRGMKYNEMTTDELSVEFSHLLDALEDTMAEDERREKAAMVSFERTVALNIELGAGDRETAVRWIRESYVDNMYGDESIRYDLCLPWNYDFDHGDQDFFIREAARRKAA